MAEKKKSVEGLNRGPWQPKEDLLLNGLKSFWLRWMNHLRHISPDEADLIIRRHKLLGINRWSLISGCGAGSTDNDVINFWNIHLGKKSSCKGVNLKTLNSEDHSISWQRDWMPRPAEPKMLFNPDESTKPRNGIV